MRFILHIHDALLRSGSAPDIGAYTQVCRFLIPLAGAQDSGDALTLVREGELHFANGDLDAALDSFRAAVREDVALADGYNNFAVVCWQRGDLVAALLLKIAAEP